MRKELAIQEWGTYQGSGVKPTDFDVYWEESKAEVEALGTDYCLQLIDFPSQIGEAYELTFRGVDDAKIVCQFVKPKRLEKFPLIFQFHGYHCNSGDLVDKLPFVGEGFGIVAMDVRVQGGQSQDTLQTSGGTLKGHLIRGIEGGKENLFYRKVYQDIYQLIKIVQSMSDVEHENLYVSGVSQGGALALVCASLCPNIKKAFVQYPFLSDFREAYNLDVTQSAYEELAYWFHFRDPLHEKEEEVFDNLEYIDIQHFVPAIEADVLCGMGLEDHICHPKTQFAVYNNIQSPKQLLFYPEYGHEYLPKYNDLVFRILKGERI